MKKPAESFRVDRARNAQGITAFRRKALWVAVVACMGGMGPMPGWAGPNGGIVIRGDASISQTPGVTTVEQRSGRAVINWNGFSVDRGELAQFKQPGKDSIALNRVVGPNRSDIHGDIKANGNVWLVNPNGVLIGPDAKVDVHGFMATTADIDDDDFMAGRNEFSKPSPNKKATVVNQGTINIGEKGLAALVAPHARNDGVIEGKLGTVIIAGTPTHTIDLYGDGLIQFEATSKVTETAEPGHALAENSGTIKVDGGTVLVTANAAAGIVDDVINVSGAIEARSFKEQGGRIVLDGGGSGAVQVAGRLDASGVESGAKGGVVKVLGEKVRVGAGATVDASGDVGGGEVLIGGNYRGEGPEPSAKRAKVEAGAVIRADAEREGDGGRVIVWSEEETVFQGSASVRGGLQGGDGGFVEVSSRQGLIFEGLVDSRAPQGRTGRLLLDPSDIEIADSNPTADPNVLLTSDLELNLGTTDLTVSTASEGSEPGDITVNGDLVWSSGNLLSLLADNNIVLNSRIDATPAVGTDGGLVLTAGGTVTTGPGGAIDVGLFRLGSGSWLQNGATLPELSAVDFQVASGANFLRVVGGDGSAAAPYLLTDVYGLQGVGSPDYLASDFRLVNSIDASGTRGWYDTRLGPAGFVPIGEGSDTGYSGIFDGAGFTIRGLFINRGTDVGVFQTIEAAATVQDLTLADVSVSGYNAGGLAAYNGGHIRNVAVSGTVYGIAENLIDLVIGGDVGGLIGLNDGTIESSAFDGSVDGQANYTHQTVGGLVGSNFGAITSSTVSGLVSVTVVNYAHVSIGGLVGFNNGGSNNSYSASSAAVSASIDGDGNESYMGGFVGENYGSIRDSSASGSVTVTAASRDPHLFAGISAGGFAGGNLGSDSLGSITRSRASGNVIVTSKGNNAVAGFVGWNGGVISQSRADGDVIYTPYSTSIDGGILRVGGFAGYNDFSLAETGAFGNVNAVSGLSQVVYAGGHTGESYAGALFDSLAQGDVNVDGGADGAVGGLVGHSFADVIGRTYASGKVSADVPNVGGLIGQVDSDIPPFVVASFWDTDSSGQSTSAAGTGLTTAQLQDTQGFQALASPLGWNFVETWAPGAPGFYPDLYSISPVIYAVPFDATGVYGQLGSVPLSGYYDGGPSIYVFGPSADTFFEDTLFSSPGIPDGDVGTYPIETLANVTSPGGQVYRIVGGPDAELTVTPAPLTIRALDQSKTYGDPLFDLGTTAFSVAGLVSGDAVTAVDLSSAGELADADVIAGGYAISASNPVGTGLGNYTIAYTDGLLSVNPAPLTALVNDATRAYGDPNPQFSANFTGFQLGQDASVLGEIVYQTAAQIDSPVAGSPYQITLTGFDNTNYVLVGATEGELTIAPAPLTAVVNDATREYADPNPPFGASFGGFKLGQDASVLGEIVFQTAAQLDSPVAGSPYAITVLGFSNTNYVLAGQSAGALNVTRAPLTVKAYDAVRSLGQENPPFSAYYSGFKLGEGPSVVSALQFSTEANRLARPGFYDIVPFGAAAANYEIQYLSGLLEVEVGSFADFGFESNVLEPEVPIPDPFTAALPLKLSEASVPVFGLSPVAYAELQGDLLFADDGNAPLWGPPPSFGSSEEIQEEEQIEEESGE